MSHGFLFHSGGLLRYAHVANEIPVFVFLGYNTFHDTLLLMFLVIQDIFVYILWNYFHISELWNTMHSLLVPGMEIGRAKYNVKHYGKHEILLLDTCVVVYLFSS